MDINIGDIINRGYENSFKKTLEIANSISTFDEKIDNWLLSSSKKTLDFANSVAAFDEKIDHAYESVFQRIKF